MCGIYGLIQTNTSPTDREQLLARMGSVIEHRGPDDHGHYVGRSVGLGMRRLSIIDVAGGHQPMSNEDETIWLVMNGEIYNFRELRPNLEQKDHKFRTFSDTEVIVHLYEEVGLEFFKYLRGMFGLALWDAKRERLVVARDRIGEKPLFVRREPGRFLFASELKSILQISDVPRQLNMAALGEYLALGYVPAPLTLLEGIESVLPGQYLVVENGSITACEYWDVPRPTENARTEGEWIELLREKLLETVKAQLVSDVPLGAFLSGGIDSSTIVAAMARLSDRPVKTYSIGYGDDDSYYNELAYAKIVAKAFGTDHHEIIVRPEVSDLLPKLMWHMDQPIADSACLTTYLVSRLARESVTVILSGVGGDELFGGYRRYLGNTLRQWHKRLPGPIRRRLLPALLKHVSQDRGSAWKDYARYAAAFLKTAELPAVERYMSYVTLLSAEAQKELVVRSGNTDSALNGAAAAALQKHFAKYPESDDLNRIIYADLKTSLPDDLLAMTDRMSMAASIECRAPLVDYQLVEMTNDIPSSMKIRGFTLKYLLKKVVAPWLPPEVINRKKRGFGAPVGSWLRRDLQPLVSDLLSEEAVRRRGLFQWSAVKNLLTAHQEQKSDHTDHIFALIALEIWCRIYLDRGDWQSAPAQSGEHVSVS